MDAQPSGKATVGEATPIQSPVNDNVIGVIPFTLQSPNLTDATRRELDEVAKRIVASRLRQVELRSFAMGSEIESRKIALARALVVRSYLLDRGVKARIEVGSFAGDGQDVQILAPKT